MDSKPPLPTNRVPRLAAWTLSLLTALIWIIVAAAYIVRPALTETPISLLQWIIALLMLVNAAIIVWLGHGLRKGDKLVYYLSLAYLLFNVLLPIADDFGLADLVYLLYTVALFVLLLLARRSFTGNTPRTEVLG
jgi:lysylphosphatidylglycerol synthetase-like protein (DUF2156 family)